MADRQSRSLLICAIEPLKTGSEFKHVPLHITVQPWFYIPDERMPALKSALINYAYDQAPFVVSGGERALLGPNRDIPVTKIAMGLGKLAAIHSDTAELIAKLSGSVESHWTGEHYLPHVSDYNQETLQPEAEVAIYALQLITGYPHDTSVKRTVSGVFYFKKGTAH